jgi:ribosomal protein L11 methyltransferase|tara:strand:- start:6895 stop:7746 length:852 start_codon:yes stop_codon:yes gene_type:complete
LISIDITDEYVEPVTNLLATYIVGSIYYTSSTEFINRTKVEICLEEAIDSNNFEFIDIGVNLLKAFDQEIDLNISDVNEKALSEFMNHVDEATIIDDLFILPKFTRQKNKNIPSSSKSIFIKPGLGFGTGKHPTTKQCIKQIHNIDNGYVLDIGAGSGILSIVSSLYGAIKCIAIEDDELAINNAIYNIKANNMEDKIELININFDHYNTSNLFDTVLANVDHTFLLNNLDNMKKFLKPGGNLIISGFQKNMQNNILKLYGKFFEIIDITDENEWICFRMLKK